jgi:ATP-dependent Clp protease ATP-binding subunit ClpA
MQYWRFIKRIHTTYKGIVARLTELSGLTDEAWHMHGRPFSTFNQQNSGKRWKPIELMIEACDLYEEAAPGAGVSLAFEFYQMVKAKYCRVEKVSQRDVTNEVIKESAEAAQAINCKDFNEMNQFDLDHAKTQFSEAIAANQKALDAIAEVEKRRAQNHQEYHPRHNYAPVN